MQRGITYLTSSSYRVVSMVMNPATDAFASASLDGTVRFWDLRANQCQVPKFRLDLTVHQCGPQGFIRSEGRPVVAYDSGGAVFAGGFDKNAIKLYDVRFYDKVTCLSCLLVTWIQP